MKKQVEPNKLEGGIPFITHTFQKSEKGITVISLIITIIVLTILSAVVVGTITGDEGIISITTGASEDYTIAQGKEKIQELSESIILSKGIMRRRNNCIKHCKRNERTSRLDKKCHSK